jgi:hypothetical protein
MQGTGGHGHELTWNKRESAMNAHSSPFGHRTFGFFLGLSLVLLAVFAAGMTIGYHVVYRNVTVAAVALDPTPAPPL